MDRRELVTLDAEGANPRADATVADTIRARKDIVENLKFIITKLKFVMFFWDMTTVISKKNK